MTIKKRCSYRCSPKFYKTKYKIKKRKEEIFLPTHSKNLIDRRASITAPRKQREEKQHD